MSKHILKPTISADDIIRWRCCYDYSSVRELLPEPQSLTDLLKRTDVSPQDRVWLATRPGVLSDWVLFNFAANCAERALRAAGVTDERCWRAVRHTRERAIGAEWDNGVAADAANARFNARFDVAGSYAARAAAYVCVAPQADAAATCTSDYAADATAYAATAYAAAQERAEQVADLLRLIESEEAA